MLNPYAKFQGFMLKGFERYANFDISCILSTSPGHYLPSPGCDVTDREKVFSLWSCPDISLESTILGSIALILSRKKTV